MAADVEKAGDVDTPDVNHGDGRVSAKNNPPEKQELLHRPHAFALMHGSGGAKIAYGELHWRIDVFTLQFQQKTVAVDPHPDHAHDHPHTHTTTSQSTTKSGTGGGYGGGSGYDTSTPDHYHDITHTHTISQPVSTDTTSGVKETDGSSSSGLTHTVTGLEGAGNVITYCDGASQSAIGNITQQVPKFPTEDGTVMDAGINETKYHDLGSFGDVYLVWKVDLENVGGEVEKCWVQVGDPAGTGINAVPMGSSTTDRRAAGDPKVGTGQPEGDDEGVFKMKIGTVTESNEITQLVSSDVVWSPTVMDRVKV